MTWISEHLSDILTWLGLPAGGFFGWLVGRKREATETRSIEVEILQRTIKALEDVNKTLRTNIDELQDDIRRMRDEFNRKCEHMENEIATLKQQIK